MTPKDVFLILNFIRAVCHGLIFFPLTIYYVTTVGMNPLQLVLVGTVVEGVILLFEVPTGILADTVSRRLSVILGFLLFGLAYVAQGLLPFVTPILLAVAVCGVAETLMSGATDAWVADEVGEKGLAHLYLQASQMERIGGLIGLTTSIGLATFALNWPILLGAFLGLGLAGFLVIYMPEQNFHRRRDAEGISIWLALTGTAREGFAVIRGQPLLLTLFAITAVIGMASEGYDRLSEAHILTNLAFPYGERFPPVIWFGLLALGGSLVGLGVVEALRRRLNIEDDQILIRTLVMLILLQATGRIAFAFAPSLAVAVICVYLIGISRSLAVPLQTAWLVRTTDSRVRATVMSLYSQSDAFGQVAGGPIVGLIGTIRGLRVAIAFTGLLLLPAVPLFSRAKRQVGESKKAIQ